jgi:hypothetical protein
MAASPEFYKPPATPAFSPLQAAVPAPTDDDCYSCRTPTVSYLREPTTCPPPPCKKRLFQQRQAPLISLRLDELHAIFRPHPPPPTADKRRRSARQHRKPDAATAAALVD